MPHSSRALTTLAAALLCAAVAAPAFAGSACSATSAAATPAHHTGSSSSSASNVFDSGNFETLVAAVEAAGLGDALAGDGPLTIFAPTDAAFAKLPAGTVESLLRPENKDQLVEVLTYHVAQGRLTAGQVARHPSVKMLNGERAPIKVRGNSVRIDGARISQTDIPAANGVIHVIDDVILPDSIRAAQGTILERLAGS